MVTKLKLSPDLSLPVEETVTRSFAVLGMRGAGKSNAAVVLAEEMFRVGLHWVAIDPKGDWWGIRSSADGKAAGGLPVVIFGGEHQDVALDPTAHAGVTLADVILGEELTCVLDLSEFSKRQKIEFLAGVGSREGFAERLFRKKKRAGAPLHIFMDEAHDYVPQQASGEVGKLIDVVSKWQTQGRQRGMGASVLSQRSARVHKDVLTQCDVLVAMRTIGPQDRKAIEDWLKYHGQSQEILASLATLADGEAWVWSPEWLGLTKRIRFRQRTTYDSGSTPTRSAARRRPATLADIDLSALEAQMKEAVAAAKAEDPKELRKNIQTLTARIRELETAGAKIVESEPVVERVEVPVATLTEEDRRFLDLYFDRVAQVQERVKEIVDDLAFDVTDPVALVLSRLQEASERLKTAQTRSPAATSQSTRQRPSARQRAPESPQRVPDRVERPTRADSARIDPSAYATGDVGDVTKPERKILDALAWWEAIGIPKPTKQQVGIIAGYRVGRRIGGHYGNLLAALRSKGLIDYPEDGRAILTGGGRALAQPPDIEATSAAIQAEVLSQCSAPERKILEVLIGEYPDALRKQELGERAGYTVGDRVGGHFGNLLGKLRTLGLIDYPSPGTAAADPVLFLEER